MTVSECNGFASNGWGRACSGFPLKGRTNEEMPSPTLLWQTLCRSDRRQMRDGFAGLRFLMGKPQNPNVAFRSLCLPRLRFQSQSQKIPNAILLETAFRQLNSKCLMKRLETQKEQALPESIVELTFLWRRSNRQTTLHRKDTPS
ncbi:Hypothetical protein NTJ_11558 [Nesidiocoris tenuis]|uniref:HAT C-terminal dimerisation domain-containing protein n=1 Tax=Nesidiocoris tenuis TaxID=355587 RepID=A0ABN7B2U4_9HEMI|nr:Hypothetical protein NTJ_11558 [Nesidiocoris tenuis]